MCTHGFILQSDWYHQTKAAEVDNFSTDVTRLSPPLVFLRREPGLGTRLSLYRGSATLYCRTGFNPLNPVF